MSVRTYEDLKKENAELKKSVASAKMDGLKIALAYCDKFLLDNEDWSFDQDPFGAVQGIRSYIVISMQVLDDKQPK